jgi:hypothetical protein
MHMNILFTLTRLLELNWLLKLKHSPHSKWYLSLITRKIMISSNTSRINSHTKRLFQYPTFLAFWLSCFVLLQQLINIFCLQYKTTSIMIQIPDPTPEVSCWNFYIKLTIKLLNFTSGYYNVDHDRILSNWHHLQMKLKTHSSLRLYVIISNCYLL